MNKYFNTLILNNSDKNLPYADTESVRIIIKTSILSVLAIAFGVISVSNKAMAADRHNFNSGKFVAEQQLGTDNDCKANQLGQIGHLTLADEKIISTNRKKHNKENLFLESSLSVSSLGFSEAKVKQFEAALSQEGISGLESNSQLSEISQKIQSLKPILSIIRGSKAIANCELSKSLDGWEISHGAWYCSNSPLTARLRANTIKLNFPRMSMSNLPDEGSLKCTNSQMQLVKPRLKRGDSVKLNFADGRTIFQASAKKRKS